MEIDWNHVILINANSQVVFLRVVAPRILERDATDSSPSVTVHYNPEKGLFISWILSSSVHCTIATRFINGSASSVLLETEMMFPLPRSIHFGPEDGGHIRVRNLGIYLQGYMMLQPKRRNHKM
jgi:hypothetical protein